MPESRSDQDSPTFTRAARAPLWRREVSLLILVGVFISLLAFLFFFLDVDLKQLRQFGYLGIFLIALIGAASMVLPLPGAAVVVGSGQIVDDVVGIPFFLLVGLVAALGEAIGELTGYAAGVGGRAVIQNQPFYRWLNGWMRHHGTSTMFTLSAIPNPLFDVGGVMAGAVRMPIMHFLIAVFLGKFIKNSLLALGGDIGIDALINALE